MVIALLGLLVALIYGLHGVHAELLNFDDNLLLGPDNQRFAEGGWLGLLDPSRPIANAYLPVAHLSLYGDLLMGGR